jgi:hypothetical protein
LTSNHTAEVVPPERLAEVVRPCSGDVKAIVSAVLAETHREPVGESVAIALRYGA